MNSKAIRQGIYQKLNVPAVTNLLANGSASIYHSVAPANAKFPLIIFNKQSGVTTARGFTRGTTGEAKRGLPITNQLWLVKAVVQASSSNTAEDIAKAVYDRLDMDVLSITGGINLYLAHESDVDYPETQGDQQYRHHGGIYRVMVSAT